MKAIKYTAILAVCALIFVGDFFSASELSMAALGLAGIDQSSADECDSCDSGVARMLAIECEGIDLEGSQFDENGCIVGLAFTGTGLAALYTPDDDNTSFVDFVGERPDNGNVHNTNIDGFTKFRCLNKDKIIEGNKLKKSCCFILVVEYNDCNVMVGGIDILENCSVDGELRLAKQKIKATVSAYGGNGSDESRLEVVWQGQQRCLTPLDQDVLTFDDILTAAGVAA